MTFLKITIGLALGPSLLLADPTDSKLSAPPPSAGNPRPVTRVLEPVPEEPDGFVPPEDLPPRPGAPEPRLPREAKARATAVRVLAPGFREVQVAVRDPFQTALRLLGSQDSLSWEDPEAADPMPPGVVPGTTSQPVLSIPAGNTRKVVAVPETKHQSVFGIPGDRPGPGLRARMGPEEYLPAHEFTPATTPYPVPNPTSNAKFLDLVVELHADGILTGVHSALDPDWVYLLDPGGRSRFPLAPGDTLTLYRLALNEDPNFRTTGYSVKNAWNQRQDYEFHPVSFRPARGRDLEPWLRRSVDPRETDPGQRLGSTIQGNPCPSAPARIPSPGSILPSSRTAPDG